MLRPIGFNKRDLYDHWLEVSTTARLAPWWYTAEDNDCPPQNLSLGNS